MPGRIERIELWQVSVPWWRTVSRTVTGRSRTCSSTTAASTSISPMPLDELLLRRLCRRFHVSTPLRVAMRAIRHKGLGATSTLQRAKAAGAVSAR